MKLAAGAMPLMLASIAIFLAWTPLAQAGAATLPPALIAVDSSRCTGQVLGEDQRQLAEFERHAPGASNAEKLHRYADLNALLGSLNEERNVLDTVCAGDDQKAPLFADLAAAMALGLALQSDLAIAFNASCPDGAKALPAAMLAGAWLSLANFMNESGAQTTPRAITDVEPKIQSRAAAVGLTLPPFADTSAYWSGQVRAKAKAIIAACPTPAPSPSP
jgi:hypothetical protein